MEIQNTQFTNVEESVNKNLPTKKEIIAWLVSYLAQLLQVDQSDIDLKIPFDRYGLDSSAVVIMTGDLEEWLGYELEPTIMYDYPTITAMAENLSAESQLKVEKLYV
ncbi:acyl carrier protein [Calothrix rhizosoleniae]|uniref:acyl carrier protein n=1 Tax=Calothrix rhizosoleniae TaxID=888997 RepID=UPI000B4A4E0E|nr:acyl carrier protein [Calothrix rhizosoleniae]